MKRSAISLLFAFVLVFSLVFAAIPAVMATESAVSAMNGDTELGAYSNLEEAAAVENATWFRLNGDLSGQIVPKDMILDLNGYDLLNVTVPEGVTLTGMDSATDDYQGTYGKVSGDIQGTLAAVTQTDVTGQYKSYVTVDEDGNRSFHRYYAAITAISLKPSMTALGYKAEFYGDETVKNAVVNYGYELWANDGAHKTFTRDDALEKETLTLRFQNILVEGNDALNAIGSTATIGGKAFVTLNLNGEEVTLSSAEHSTSLRQTVEAVNAAAITYTQAQLDAVKAMCTTHADYMTGWATENIFTEASESWQITGTAERYDDVTAGATYFNVLVSDGNKMTTVSCTMGGIAIDDVWGDDPKCTFNISTAESLLSANRTVNQAELKVAVYNDTLYGWLAGKLCWRVPLTDANYGGYAAGSSYRLVVSFGNGVTADLKDVTVLRAEQVTEQEGFAQNLAVLDANIARWDSMRLGHACGDYVESFTVDYGTWDHAYGYFAPAKGDMGLKVTTGWVDPAAEGTWSRVGVTVKLGDTSHQFVLEEQNSEVKHFTNFGDAVNISADVMRYVNPFKADKSCDMMALIRDGKLYLYYNGVQGYMVSMGQLFPGYTADSDVSLGICNLDSQTGIGTFENIEILSAQDVAVQAATGDLVANMNYDSMTGAYLPVTQNGPAYLYGAPIVGNQAISTTIHYYNGEISNNGITIKIGDQSVQVVGHGGYDYMRIWKNQGESQINEFPHPMTVNNIYSQIKAVINNGKLYLFYNGAQMNPINLTELFPSYQTTDAIALGIYSHDAQADWVRFTDTQFHTTAAQVDSLVRFYVASNSGANMDTANGNIVKNGYAQVQLEGVSNVWEVTGTLYNYVPGSYLQPAFEVRDTNGAGVQAMIDGNGIQFPWGDYRENDPYCINPNTGHFHWWGINEMDFRIVVANDILYAWFETAGDGNLIASWRIPLSEYYNGTAYGGCAAGSQYTFKLLLGGDDAVNGQSGLMNVVVRTGENASTEGIW